MSYRSLPIAIPQWRSSRSGEREFHKIGSVLVGRVEPLIVSEVVLTKKKS